MPADLVMRVHAYRIVTGQTHSELITHALKVYFASGELLPPEANRREREQG